MPFGARKVTGRRDGDFFHCAAIYKKASQRQTFAERAASSVKPRKRHVEFPCRKVRGKRLVQKIPRHQKIHVFHFKSRPFHGAFDGFVKHFAFGDFKGFLTDKVVVQNLVEVFRQTAFALFRAYDGITTDNFRPDVFKNISLLSFFHKNNPTIPTTTDAVMPNTIIGPAMVNIFAQTP